MTEIQAVGLQRRTVNIMDNFFDYIDKLDHKNIDSYQMKLAIRVKEFFDAMNNVGIEEFASLLKKHRFENRDPAQLQKYTDAFDCLVAFIVAKYNERDLLRYFLPKEFTIEAKPTSESSSWRIVYWAQLLGYWVRKLFNTQRFEIVNAETANESLGSAIEVIKQKLKKGNYFDLQQNSDFKENLKMVVGKFVENRNKATVEHAENDTSSNGDVSPQLDNSDKSFRKKGFTFGSSTSISELATKLMLSPSPSPSTSPAPAPNIPVIPVAVPSTSSNASNDRDNLLERTEAIGVEKMTGQPIANVNENLQSQQTNTAFGNFFSRLFTSKKEAEADEQPVKNMTFTP